jgi:hypothetical protein
MQPALLPQSQTLRSASVSNTTDSDSFDTWYLVHLFRIAIPQQVTSYYVTYLNILHISRCIADVKPSTASLVEKKAMAKEVLDKVKEQVNTKLEEAKGAGGAKAAMATKLALMKLKGRAKGDNSVPQAERVFFTVECPNKQQNPQPLDLFMGKQWTMGKAVDFLARQARIKNRNNQADAPKLHIFKGETCLTDPFEKTVNELLSGGIIVDGDALSFQYLQD